MGILRFSTTYFRNNVCSSVLYKSIDFFVYSSMVVIKRAGFPAQTSPSGMSFVTILPAPIMQLLPIFTFGRIVELQPIKTLLPIFILPYLNSVKPLLFCNCSQTCTDASWVKNVHPNDIQTSSPISINHGSDPKSGNDHGCG